MTSLNNQGASMIGAYVICGVLVVLLAAHYYYENKWK